MKHLGLSSLSVGAALACAVMPLSVHWSPTKVASISVDHAEARLGQRPSIARNVAAVGRRTQRGGYRRATAGAAAVGVGTDAYVAGSAPPYYGPGYGYGPLAIGYAPEPAPVVAGYGSAPAGAVVNPVTGRWCTTQPNGYQWCWTP